VESGEQKGSEHDSGEDEDESGEEREEGDEDAATPQKPWQKKATQKQKVVVETSVQKKATQNPATSPMTGRKCKPATSHASPMAGKKGMPATSPTASKRKWDTLPHQPKEKSVDHYADYGEAAGKRKVWVGKKGGMILMRSLVMEMQRKKNLSCELC
jgi:hypothetical protein